MTTQRPAQHEQRDLLAGLAKFLTHDDDAR
jgi:hypothetical protein